MAHSTFVEYREAVRAKLDLRALARSVYHLDVDAKGMACCPFHPDSDPSLSLHKNPAGEAMFHCFGCHAAGDTFSFIQRMEGLSFYEALNKAADFAGIPHYRPVAQDSREWEAERQIESAIDEAGRYYHAAVGTVRDYLVEERGLPEALLDTHQLGYSDGSFPSALLAAWGGSWAPILDAAGLTNRGVEDRLAGRAIFPSLQDGVAVGLSGRLLPGHEGPKYLHLRHRLTPLYNTDALRGETIIITEGPLDCLSLVAWGFPAVGLHGGANRGVINTLRRPRLRYLCFDADAAGAEATLRWTQMLGPGALTRVVALPPGMDPNDYYRRCTAGEFSQLLERAEDPVSFFLHRISPTLGPGEVDQLVPVWKLLASYPVGDAEFYLERQVALYFKWSRRMIKAMSAQLNDYRAGRVQ